MDPDYRPDSDLRPLSDEELAELDDWLAAIPRDAAFNLAALDGYLSALLLAPTPLGARRAADWLPLVWGGDDEALPPAFASGKLRKRLVQAVLRHARHLQEVLLRQPEAWQPVFDISEDESAVDAGDWALGFLSAVDLEPEAWAARPALLHALEALAGDALDESARDAASRALPDLVLARGVDAAPAA